ncbi:hypothetical protein ASJ79_22985 [Mycobacterium sp. NAZ190054]|nr:hypothetical protein ASJ79_22985 [Mycobacterium sp. NAZ190054]
MVQHPVLKSGDGAWISNHRHCSDKRAGDRHQFDVVGGAVAELVKDDAQDDRVRLRERFADELIACIDLLPLRQAMTSFALGGDAGRAGTPDWV